MEYASEFLSLYKIPLSKCNSRIIYDRKRLSIEEFSSNTIFINKAKEIIQDNDCFELVADEICNAITKEKKCIVPNISIFDHSVIIPRKYQSKGRTIAYLLSNDNIIPFIIFYPGNRFVINGDICDIVDFIRREKYFIKKRPIYTYLPFNIQNIPSKWRIKMAELMQGEQKETSKPLFPRYPMDYSVEILIGLLMYCFEKITNTQVNTDIWPGRKKYAFILTHDVDSDWVYDDNHLDRFLKLEKIYNITGAWYFVANRYRHKFKKIDLLMDEGHEIGLHGHNHDHKIAFLSPEKMKKRFEKCKWFIDQYNVYGFRSPHFLRTPLLYETLKDYIKYDTSIHSTYIPTSKVSIFREGCSTTLPFLLSDNNLFELPITIQKDFELFDVSKGSSSIIDSQINQINEIKNRGGLATLVVHPEKQFTAQKPLFEAFEEVIRFVSQDDDCLICRPKDIYKFWLGIS